MTIWTVHFRSPQNSNQKTRTKMAGTTKVDSQLLEPCIFTSSCLERHSVPSKRNLLFLFDSKPPYSGKKLQMNLRQISYIPNLQFPDGNWAVLKTPLAWWHGGMVYPYLFKTTGPNKNNQSVSGMFPCIVISADFFRPQNVLNHKTIDLANI